MLPLLQVRNEKDKARPKLAEEGAACIEHNGFRVWKLAQPRIIRRPIGPPTRADGSFYYNLLLSEKAFRDEAVITPANGDFFLQCVRQKVFTTQEQLDGFIQQYADYNLWDVTRLNELRDRSLIGFGRGVVRQVGRYEDMPHIRRVAM